MKVIINNEQDKISFDEELENLIQSVMRQAAVIYQLAANCEVGITLVDNAEIQQINA